MFNTHRKQLLPTSTRSFEIEHDSTDSRLGWKPYVGVFRDSEDSLQGFPDILHRTLLSVFSDTTALK